MVAIGRAQYVETKVSNDSKWHWCDRCGTIRSLEYHRSHPHGIQMPATNTCTHCKRSSRHKKAIRNASIGSSKASSSSSKASARYPKASAGFPKALPRPSKASQDNAEASEDSDEASGWDNKAYEDSSDDKSCAKPESQQRGRGRPSQASHGKPVKPILKHHNSAASLESRSVRFSTPEILDEARVPASNRSSSVTAKKPQSKPAPAPAPAPTPESSIPISEQFYRSQYGRQQDAGASHGRGNDDAAGYPSITNSRAQGYESATWGAEVPLHSVPHEHPARPGYASCNSPRSDRHTSASDPQAHMYRHRHESRRTSMAYSEPVYTSMDGYASREQARSYQYSEPGRYEAQTPSTPKPVFSEPSVHFVEEESDIWTSAMHKEHNNDRHGGYRSH